MLMAQHDPDRLEVDPAVESPGGEGVTKHMAAAPEAQGSGVAGHDLVEVPPADGPAREGAEEGLVGPAGWRLR